MPIESLRVAIMRLEINGAQTEFTSGVVIDHATRKVRARIMESGIPLDEGLRSLRAGNIVDLRLWSELPDGSEQKMEYEGKAEVQMIRFRATRQDCASFRTQFKLIN